jgi:O-antigen ligase
VIDRRLAIPGTLLASAVAGSTVSLALSRYGIVSAASALVVLAALGATLADAALAAVAYVYVGVFKTSDAFADPNSPVPTAAIVVALAFGAARVGNQRRLALWLAALLPATGVLVANAVFIAGGDDASLVKVVRIVILSFVPSVLAASIFADPARGRRFLAITAIVGGAVGGLIVVRATSEGLSAVGLTLFNENRIVLGRALATGSLAAIAMASTASRGWLRAIYLGLATSAGMAAFFSSSRGAVVGLVVGAVVVYAISVRTSRARALVPATAAVIISILLVVAPDTDLAGRYLALATPGSDVTSLERLFLASAAFGEFAASPVVGSGLGTFLYAFDPASPPATYAHNLFLELLSETGITGALAVTLPLGMCLWLAVRALRNRRSPELVALLGLFASAFVAAQFSGDLQINRHVFFFAGALWGLSAAVVSPDGARSN